MAKQVHECNQIAEVTKLRTEVNAINHVLNDNGQKGMITVVTELRLGVDQWKEETKDLKTAIHAINNFMVTVDTERKEAEKKAVTFRWAVGVFLTIVTILFGSGVLSKKETIYLPINNRSVAPDGKPYDSVFWNDEDNPVMEIELQ